MAGAVAFVFGLCALSFAAGCVVTAVMLRNPDPEEAAPEPPAPPEPVPVPVPPLRLLLPPDAFAEKPIHRNPVVGLPALVKLDHDTPTPDPTFTGVFDPPPARLPVPADEVADQSPPPVEEMSFTALPNNGRANWSRVDPWTGRSLYDDQALLLEAACTRQPTTEPLTDPPPVSAPPLPTARNGEQRPITANLVAQPELSPTTEPEPELAPQAAEPEPDTMFVSCSGLVTDPELTAEAEPVVPEQGANAPLVVPKQHVVPNDEFRKRYLRTFEAARRRSNH
ncbi:hypothetical protein ACFFQW_07200 [Umezawaea endophytica]|uniref:Uncharacterized protein n=1 Tax=Umezawaea endophytica TaxID=1654476 RepID=A0A9X2VPF3_9PSEU|nr:hypothetical protein [Umezawaea endophytica]MCS7480117.1 hypothetical protein [Umezawaea endophytica]